MRLHHFELLKPECPVCIDRFRGLGHRLILSHVEHDTDTDVIEGILQCSHPNCQSEFPIIDGIPLIHPQLRAYLSENFFHIFAREDLSESTESLIGDACSQGSFFDTVRQHISCYTWDHYAEFDPLENVSEALPKPGSIRRVLEAGLSLCDSPWPGPTLEIGCGVGRTTFDLASRCDGDVLGIDVHFSMLRIASHVLQKGVVSYPRRRSGLVYDRRTFPVPMQSQGKVDFWMCDAHALPFSSPRFHRCVALHVLDSVRSPIDFLQSIHRVLHPQGEALLSCPYDWTTAVTPIEAWLGGHSQRNQTRGDSVTQLKRFLQNETGMSQLLFAILAEKEGTPWTVRLHDRSLMQYRAHLLRIQKRELSSSEEQIHQYQADQ